MYRRHEQLSTEKIWLVQSDEHRQRTVYHMSEGPTRFLPEHIRDSLDSEIPAQRPAHNICLYNFEASNIAADVVSSYIFENHPVQVHTIVDRMVPAWVNDSVDVVIMSYTGNSPEVDEVYTVAKQRTSRIHCITSGGRLKELCEKGGDQLLLVPQGLSNSDATGYEIGILANLYESMGIQGIREALEDSLPRIMEYRDSVWDSEYAEHIASFIGGRIPVIYCIGELRAVHKRWKMLINQVLGRLAFSGELPEFDHNEIVSWTEDKDSRDFVILLFRTQTESELLDKIVGTVTELLPEYDLNIEIIGLEGRLMERGIKGIILADAVISRMEEVQRCQSRQGPDSMSSSTI